jgi:glycerate 2-kinase
MKIKNMAQLNSSGDVDARRIMLDIVERSLQELDSYHVISNLLKLKGSILHIGGRQWDLSRKRRVFVVGAGKACNAMARAVDEILGHYITEGVVIVKKLEDNDKLQHIELVTGGHPLPNQDGLKASQRILQLVDKATSDDFFIGLISGGSSALMTCPVPGITLSTAAENDGQII